MTEKAPFQRTTFLKRKRSHCLLIFQQTSLKCFQTFCVKNLTDLSSLAN